MVEKVLVEDVMAEDLDYDKWSNAIHTILLNKGTPKMSSGKPQLVLEPAKEYDVKINGVAFNNISDYSIISEFFDAEKDEISGQTIILENNETSRLYIEDRDGGFKLDGDVEISIGDTITFIELEDDPEPQPEPVKPGYMNENTPLERIANALDNGVSNPLNPKIPLERIADALEEQIGTSSEDKGMLAEKDYLERVAIAVENGAGQGGGSEPTGEIEITENGVVDVTNYASANVNVSSEPIPEGSFIMLSEIELGEYGVDEAIYAGNASMGDELLNLIKQYSVENYVEGLIFHGPDIRYYDFNGTITDNTFTGYLHNYEGNQIEILINTPEVGPNAIVITDSSLIDATISIYCKILNS